MHILNKKNIVHTLLRTCSKKSNKKLKVEQQQQHQPSKKDSIQTLDSFQSSSTNSIKSFAKRVVITSIANSGISVSRSGSIVPTDHHHHKSTIDNNDNSRDDILSPDEDEEVDRMVSQHYILRTAFDNADFSAPINSMLSQQKEDAAVVLDVGCGSGTWTMEIATQFPYAKFIGIDKKPLFPNDIKPRNCQFKLFDITANIDDEINLPFEDASVDFIFQRDLNWGLSESTWLPLVKEYFRILKPGGWIELVEPDIETHSCSSYEDILMNKLINAFYQRHQDPFISKRLSSFMATAGFRRIQSDFKSIPLGWGFQKLFHNKKKKQQQQQQTTVRCSEFARAAANHRLDLLKSLQPWFSRENNISKTKYLRYINQLSDEWYQTRAYTNWHRSTAQKPLLYC